MKIVECVPNISEGRRPEIYNAVAEAAAAVAGVELLDVDPGIETNRTVITFVGEPDAVIEGAFQLVVAARRLIDMRDHHGAHGRMGAVDVCPFVPVAGVTMDDCVEYANRLGKRVGGGADKHFRWAADIPAAKKLAFIQCVGSRDFRFHKYCSSYCCMHSIKEAIIAHEHEPETTSTIFGMDIRAVSKGFEEYKIRGGNHSNITYVRGRVSEIMEGSGNNPIVIYEDTQKRKVERQEFDMVILATACAPTKGIGELSKIFGVELDEYNFIKTSSVSPVDTTIPGIFVCGCAESPMDVPESVAQASSAAERAAEIAIPLKSEKEKAVA